MELIYIRDILGHSSVTTTEIYAKVCTSNKRAALEKAYENVVDQSDENWSDNKDFELYDFCIPTTHSTCAVAAKRSTRVILTLD